MTDPKQTIAINLKKARSLIGKIMQMTEDGVYCVDIMQQNLAVIGLLRSVDRMFMKNHLNTCFRKAMETSNEKRKREMTEEIINIMKLSDK